MASRPDIGRVWFTCAVPVLSALVAIGLCTRLLASQDLRGSVRDSASHEPISGAVVLLLDSSGVVLVRRITDERGQFRIATASAARWARVVRIGFQPREIRVPTTTDGAAAFDVTMMSVPTMLASVRIKDQSHCPRRNDRAAALGLWEQARAGLLATIVGRESSPAIIHRLAFERTLDGNSDRITRFLVSEDSAVDASKSFNAVHSAKDFVTSGFSTDSAGTQTLFAPDADVLLDDAFAGGYCFRLAEPSHARPRQVGLAFAPAEHPRDRVDIDGTLWVDTAARALRDIDYRYVGLPFRADDYHPGGRISFRQMANGIVLIDRWYIRGVSAVRDTLDVAGRLRVRDRLYATENGGELARARWPDGQTWHASLGALRIHAVTGTMQPAAGTVIALPGTPYRATADTSGEIWIADLVPGPYSVEVVDPRLAQLGIGLSTPVHFVAARDSTFQSTLQVPGAEEYVVNRCVGARQWEVGDSVFVLGRVVTLRGRPIAGAKVTLSVRMNTGLWSLLENFWTTGTDGIFQSCSRSFDPGGTVKIHVQRAGLDAVDAIVALSPKLTIVRIPVPAEP